MPEIPLAEEVEQEGVDVLEMEKKLLKKVEELTLHMIDMKKENEQLRKEIKALKQKMK